MSNGTRSWDVYYFSPGGAKFRSKAAVARELGLEPPTRGGRGRKAADDDDDDEPPPKSRPPPLDEEEEIFSVDALLARRPAPKGGRGVEYLVRWEARTAAIPYSAIPPQFCAAAAHRTPFRRAQGYGRAEDLWVPAGNILDKSLVRVFEAARSKPPPPIGGSRGPPAERRPIFASCAVSSSGSFSSAVASPTHSTPRSVCTCVARRGDARAAWWRAE